MNLIFIALATFISTFIGGLFALKFKDKLHLILGFSAGAIIAVAMFDLLPEAIELGSKFMQISTITSITAIGFIIFMILDRFSVLNHCHEEDEHHHHKRGRLGAGSLSIHSFFDGMAVGIAFQISSIVGIVIAVAVLAHDFSDGINTVNMIIKNGGTKKTAIKWLLADSIAPVLGILSTLLFSVPEKIFGIILALFCGFFFYIGASDLLPESHHKHPTIWTTLSTIIGMAFIYTAIKIAGV